MANGKIDHVDSFLPPLLVSSIKRSKTREEWQAKLRYLVAVIFYRVRSFEFKTRLLILRAFQPTEQAVLSSRSAESIGLMASLISELQAHVVEAHEKLARAFLDHTTVGRDFLRKRTEQRSVQIRYDYGLLETDKC